MTKVELEKLAKAKRENPQAGRTVLARMTGVHENKVKTWLKRNGAVAVKAAVKKARSLSDFRATYDKSTIVPTRVKAALKEMGSNGWEYEVAFAKLAGVSLNDLGLFRDEFSGYIVTLRDSRRAWAGSEKMAKTMREMI